MEIRRMPSLACPDGTQKPLDSRRFATEERSIFDAAARRRARHVLAAPTL